MGCDYDDSKDWNAGTETENAEEWGRREVVLTGAAIAAGLAGSMLVSDDADAAKPPEKEFAKAGDRIQLIKGDHKNEFVKPEMLTVGDRPIEAFPYATADGILRRRNRLNRLLVLRLDPAEMDEETRARSVDGVLVYSALCTHRACTIKSWMEAERRVRCHCHLSEFATLNSGKVESGPARRSLPAIPVELDDEGFIVAADGFNRKPGPAKK